MSGYITLTYVVRAPEALAVEDPRELLTDDEIMFWGSEEGISQKALDLGADPDMWDDSDDQVEGSHPEHTECADGCGLNVDHGGACRERPGGHVVCEHWVTCRHCGRQVKWDDREGWIDPEAGYDDEDGDGVWRVTCDANHEDRIAAHEPSDEQREGWTYVHTHASVNDGSTAMLVSQTEVTITLVNEDGHQWTDPRTQWRPIADLEHPHDYGYYEEN